LKKIGGIINYWPMNNLIDLIGGANLFGGSSYSFVPDRFGVANSAIYFNHGYLQVPAGVYFSGDFTVTAWIYLNSYQLNSRIFDFGNGPGSDNIGLAFSGTSSIMYGIDIKGNSELDIHTSSMISLNQWYFIAYVLSGTTGCIYVNGNQVINGPLHIPNNITRTNNYIGKSNWLEDSNADAIYDEIKIYNQALSSIEISNQYSVSLKYGK